MVAETNIILLGIGFPIDRHIRSFCIFDLVPVKKKHKRKNVTFSKIYKYMFFKILFQNKKKWAFDALLLEFVNEIKS